MKWEDLLISEVGSTIKCYHNLMHIKFEEFGLHKGQHMLILELSAKEGMTQKEICEKIKVTPATVTKMISRMEKKGLCEKKADPNDKRTTRIYLTDKSRELKKQLDDSFVEFEETLFKNFSTEEKEIFKTLVRKFKNNIKDEIKELKGERNGIIS